MAGGISGSPEANHLQETIDFALMLLETVRFSRDVKIDENTTKSVNFELGFGISTGPLVACIVGKKRFLYEVKKVVLSSF